MNEEDKSNAKENMNNFIDQVKLIKQVIEGSGGFSEDDIASVRKNLETIRKNIEKLAEEANKDKDN